MKRRRVIAALVAMVFGAGCAATPLALPDPILGLNDRHVTRSAILEGMAVRGWLVEQEVGSRILARLERRTHVAKVWVDYGEQQIVFSYGGSRGLDCTQEGDSCRSIHGNYNRWVRNLALDISRALTKRRAVEKPPAAA